MPASLNDKPMSSTALQHQTLVIAGNRKGFDLGDIRKMVGGSLRKLSARQASEWITVLSGKGLPNKPGQAPRSAYRKRHTDGATKIISAAQIDQIARLSVEYFINAGYEDPQQAAAEWLLKDFKVDHPRELATAERAGQVIAALKEMQARQRSIHR